MNWNKIKEIEPYVWGLIAAAGCLIFGAVTGNVLACLLSVALIGIIGRFRWQVWQQRSTTPVRAKSPQFASRKGKAKKRTAKLPSNPKDYIRNMINQGRYALLLRDEVVGSIGINNARRAYREMEAMMSPVVAGEVSHRTPILPNVGTPGEPSNNASDVSDFFIDRFAVTNEDFKRFIDDDGYFNDEYWAESIRSARGEFTDKTGLPGPRFWTNGSYAPGEADHPVVGVSWYEAQAYARWQGKRLPTDAEWTKAASSPKTESSLPSHQRKYPWGPTLDDGRANLWSTGIGATVAVDEFEDGDTICEVRQLVGNVWEWTSDDFPGPDAEALWDIGGSPWKSLRGGAFDTYFEHHVTCESRSADDPTARKHNVGFRCAVHTKEINIPDAPPEADDER